MNCKLVLNFSLQFEFSKNYYHNHFASQIPLHIVYKTTYKHSKRPSAKNQNIRKLSFSKLKLSENKIKLCQK